MKYLIIEKSAHDDYYDVFNKKNRDNLGMIWFYKKWSKWVFEPMPQGLIFDSECLQDIISYMDKL